jgi:peptidoglycan-N-acetylmuramic acid deacetylase
MILVLAIILVVFGIADKLNSDLPDDTSVTENSETNTDNNSEEDTSTQEDTNTEEDTSTEESTDTEVNTETNTGAEDTENKEESTNKVPSDLASLSNTSEGWGPGGDRNELGQYHCCFWYNDKYSDYDAYFMVENSNYIYLTMDEGYENGYTPAILDTLKEKNVKVVFFVTSQFVKSNPELVQRMIDEGHTVGNHSTSHPSKGMPSLSVEAQKNDIMNLHNVIKNDYGYEMTLFRNPAGIFSEQSLAVTKSCGYKSIFWSFAYPDWDNQKQMSEEKAKAVIMENIHNGEVLLLHPTSKTNALILGDVIRELKAQGFRFGTLDELTGKAEHSNETC